MKSNDINNKTREEIDNIIREKINNIRKKYEDVFIIKLNIPYLCNKNKLIKDIAETNIEDYICGIFPSLNIQFCDENININLFEISHCFNRDINNLDDFVNFFSNKEQELMKKLKEQSDFSDGEFFLFIRSDLSVFFDFYIEENEVNRDNISIVENIGILYAPKGKYKFFDVK